MNDDLKRLISTAGASLEEEDRNFQEAISANQQAYPGGKGGILRINNERYYQFVIARRLALSFPYAVDIEVKYHDLVVKRPGKESPWFAVVEMKRWMSASGGREIREILLDIQKLRSVAQAEHAVLLIFSANPKNQTRENLEWLAKKLDLPRSNNPDEHYCFATLDKQGAPFEFWVAGFEIPMSRAGTG